MTHKKNNSTLLIYLETLCTMIMTKKLVSFDIQNMFTNIRLDKAIEQAIEILYPKLKIKKENLNTYLKLFTKKKFYFNNNYYKQVEGLSMKSPLSPIMAEIYRRDF